MIALVRKELRQVLPALMFQALLLAGAGLAILPPHEVLAPYHELQGWLHAIVAAVCFVEGIVLGYGQFAYERWQGTEAYLVHRATGRAGAFRAKALAGMLALATLVVLPPGVFGAVHLSEHPYAGSASVTRLGLIALASCTAFVGYGAGVLATNLGRSLVGRVCHALLLAATSTLVVLLAVLPLSVGPQPMALRFALVVLALTAALLWCGRETFAGRESRSHAGERIASFAYASLVAALCLPPLALLPYLGLDRARAQFEADAPEIVADDRGELFIATPTDRDRKALWQHNRDLPSYGRVFDIVDLTGEPVPEELALQHTGWSGNSPFETVVDAGSMRRAELGDEHPLESRIASGLPFGLTGPWLSREVNSFPWCFERDSGEHWVSGRRFDPLWMRDVAPDPHWWRLDARTPDFHVVPGVTRAGSYPGVFLVEEEARFLRLVASEELGGPALVEVPLPGGDRFVELGMLYSIPEARLGLSVRRRGLVIGERGRYVWNGMGWSVWEDVEELDRMGLATLEELPALRTWTLEVTPTRGLGYRVALLDPASGAPAVELDVLARTDRQRRSEALAIASCLAMPPLAAVHSWFQPLRDLQGPPMLALGTNEVQPLHGQRRTWIVALLVVLTAWLVHDLGRRLARRGAPAERRLLWCLLTAALGLPAYLLARAVECPGRRVQERTAARREPSARTALEIVTA